MKKRWIRILCAALVVAVLLSVGMYTLADEKIPTVAYSGKTHGFTAYDASPFLKNTNVDLFPDFKNVMPGDALTQTIKVRAEDLSAASVVISLHTEDVLADETADAAKANADYQKLLSDPEKVRLEVYVDGVLKNAGDLQSGVSLGSFRSGTSRTITIKLIVDKSVGNELQGLQAMIDWVFEAEERADPVFPGGGAGLLDKTDHVTYVIGYPDGTVRPQRNITRAEVATIFFRLLTDQTRAKYWSKTNDFSDVAYDKWYNNAISTMANMGIVKGYPDGTFRPDTPISRAEFAAIAARFSDAKLSVMTTFSDVPTSYWAHDEISLAEQIGWVNGYPDGTFRPKQDITRAEAMTLVNRMLERAVEEEHMLPDMHVWPDNKPTDWFYEAVQEATNTHTYGRINKFVPGLNFKYEDWKQILVDPDWAALEKEWSKVNDK